MGKLLGTSFSGSIPLPKLLFKGLKRTLIQRYRLIHPPFLLQTSCQVVQEPCPSLNTQGYTGLDSDRMMPCLAKDLYDTSCMPLNIVDKTLLLHRVLSLSLHMGWGSCSFSSSRSPHREILQPVVWWLQHSRTSRGLLILVFSRTRNERVHGNKGFPPQNFPSTWRKTSKLWLLH